MKKLDTVKLNLINNTVDKTQLINEYINTYDIDKSYVPVIIIIEEPDNIILKQESNYNI